MSELRDRLETIFARFGRLKIVMLGDFFIDQYMDMFRDISENSLETGLEAYQVIGIRNQLGAAGTVANNLCAMGVKVKAITMHGDDANGYIMDQLMMQQDIDLDGVVVDGRIFTPTYIKPMMEEKKGRVHELNRMDIKNRLGILPDLETTLIEQLDILALDADAVLVTDQVQEPGCGVVTNGMRIALSQMARRQPELPIWVDSRERGMFFLDVSLKTNLSEARKVLGIYEGDCISAEEAAIELSQKNKKPVLITDGENGIAYCMGETSGVIPALQMAPPIDIVGAGDSVLAAAGCAIAAGAALNEAALIGCLAASVTIKKLGTTGTASVEEMLENLTIFEAQNPNFALD